MNEERKRPEDGKVSTSIEFVVALYREMKDRGFEPQLALPLAGLVVLDLRLYDIMRSVDTIAEIMDRNQ